MRSIIKLALIFIIGITFSCAHHSTAKRPEYEIVINAPIDVVWEKTLQILETEGIRIISTDKDAYSIYGVKIIREWIYGDNISIQLFPEGNNQTAVHLAVKVKKELRGWGHPKRMVEDIFNKIKNASENR